jgi:hypothetical protein
MSSTSPSPWLTRLALALGILELLGAGLWCVGGAGIYGSPLVGMSADELTKVWAFLLVGPFSVLPAALAMWWNSRLGTAWLVVAGVLSGCLGTLFLSTDAGVFPILLVSLPMLVLGVWQWYEETQSLADRPSS